MTGIGSQVVPERRGHWLIGRWRTGMWRLSARRAVAVSTITGASVLLIALIALSPLALKEVRFLPGLDWSRLSNIGQTYGAASALLTGLALIGVTGSLLFQARAVQASREQSSREHGAHLVEMSLNDPVYQRCWGDDPESHVAPDDWRQRVYLNLIMSYWDRDYLLGALDDGELRHALDHFFRGEAARRWWADIRNHQAEIARVRRARRFVRIVNEEYEAAVTSGPPEVREDAQPGTPVRESRRAKLQGEAVKTGSAVLLGVLGGAILSKSFSAKGGSSHL
jgi:hypothetical protein